MIHSQNQPVTFVIPGDLHLTHGGLPNHQSAVHLIDEITHLVQPDFVQFIGDNVQHARDDEFVLFRDLTSRLRVPWYALVGDHDVHRDPDAKGFRQWVGEPIGAMTVNNVRFLRLNTQEARPLGLTFAQIEWLESELRQAQTIGQRVVIFQHNYPYQIWEDFSGPGIDDWRRLVHTYPIAAIFSGHTHYGQIANDGQNLCITTRSIGDPEGGAPGYLLAAVENDDLAVTYRTVEDVGPIILITHPRAVLLTQHRGHLLQEQDEIRARVWSHLAIKRVQVRIDRGDWFPARQIGKLDWSAQCAGSALAVGNHQITVASEDEIHQQGIQTLTFHVPRRGKFTAVPAVEPNVTTTDFC